jgi:hypothetical protein
VQTSPAPALAPGDAPSIIWPGDSPIGVASDRFLAGGLSVRNRYRCPGGSGAARSLLRHHGGLSSARSGSGSPTAPVPVRTTRPEHRYGLTATIRDRGRSRRRRQPTNCRPAARSWDDAPSARRPTPARLIATRRGHDLIQSRTPTQKFQKPEVARDACANGQWRGDGVGSLLCRRSLVSFPS